MNISHVKSKLAPYRIGFVRGHSYCKDEEISQIYSAINNIDSSQILGNYEKTFGSLIGSGHVISFAAGRMAFYALMKMLGIGPGDEVVLLAFTCSVMPNAVWRVGATPVFSDIDINTFGSDVEEISKCCTSRTKMIVAQHSFGIPCNIKPIAEMARDKNIFLLEDCAISLDSSVDGINLGNWGNAAIFSTDHSKPLNTMIGGILYMKDFQLYRMVKEYSDSLPSLNVEHQLRLFNKFLFERNFYRRENSFTGVMAQILESITERINLCRNRYTFLETDNSESTFSSTSYPYPAKMPGFLSQIGLFELCRWQDEKRKRKHLLSQYLDIASGFKMNQFLPNSYYKMCNDNLDIVPLRFVFTHPDSRRIIEKMSDHIDTNWIWFREPVIGTRDGAEKMGYISGSCAKSEEVCRSIINFPCVLEEKWHQKALDCFSNSISN
jgi:perosamine synthetase